MCRDWVCLRVGTELMMLMMIMLLMTVVVANVFRYTETGGGQKQSLTVRNRLPRCWDWAALRDSCRDWAASQNEPVDCVAPMMMLMMSMTMITIMMMTMTMAMRMMR